MSINKSHSEVGDRINFARTKGTRTTLSQKEFADSLGVKQSWISEIESGKKQPTQLLLIAIEYRYKISADWLRTGEGDIFIKDFLPTPPRQSFFGADPEKINFRTRTGPYRPVPAKFEGDIEDRENSTPKEGQDHSEDPEIEELLSKARKVLTSGNQLAYDALARNINYFAHAVEAEKLLMDVVSRLAAVEEELRVLKQKRKSRRGGDPPPGGSAEEQAM